MYEKLVTIARLSVQISEIQFNGAHLHMHNGKPPKSIRISEDLRFGVVCSFKHIELLQSCIM